MPIYLRCTPAERLWRHTVSDLETGCWVWIGTARKGYGQIKVDTVRWQAHRYAYSMLIGPIPDRFDIDHLCRNPSCVNPLHLEAVTRGDNVRRGKAGQHRLMPTACGRGHPRTAENVYTYSNGRGRYCRLCRNAWRREAKRARASV